MTKAERIIKYISSECHFCKANIDLLCGNEKECMNDECFEAHSYAIECIRRVKEELEDD